MRKARRNPQAHLRALTRTIPIDSHGYPLDIHIHDKSCDCYYFGGTRMRNMRVRYINNCPARSLPNTTWPPLDNDPVYDLPPMGEKISL